MIWKLAEAKNKLSEVVSLARDEGPQFVTRRDEEYVVMTKEEYLRLTGEKPTKTFVEHLLSMPKGDDLDLTRKPSYPREIEW
ncbi:MAG TPA: type II toxin-antitoxin system prevent-host-death family antitoxin [Thermomicrobiales bacterium]|nr:type II toxin-antitoxin system prevent-host-death family antitoxin [Thermomicrobiales bacterium]